MNIIKYLTTGFLKLKVFRYFCINYLLIKIRNHEFVRYFVSVIY
jgi:hypothetical protein